MSYRLTTTERFDRQFKRLDRSVQKTIKNWIDKHLVGIEDPRAIGGMLVGNLAGYWKYRIGDYRMIVEINDDELKIVAIDIDHRSAVYKKWPT